ncbi:MAG: SPFH domain-containing protein [Defluviitaleaceae bacterium]|nr:SPFH domain-containing protein [Defluviitaleaceae bacterium]
MNETKSIDYEEREPKALSGMAVLVLNTLAVMVAEAAFVIGIIIMANKSPSDPLGVTLFIVGMVYGFLIGWIPYLGLKVIKPNEAYVFTLFGKYYGTIKREGFYFVNPFVAAVNPAAGSSTATSSSVEQPKPVTVSGVALQSGGVSMFNKKISLKVNTLNNEKQKINDQLGNPIIIGIVVVWKVVNPTKAVFNVDHYKEFLSIQCDSALRNIVRLYPYDTFGDDNEKTLRGSSQEIAMKLKDEIQSKVGIAGIEVNEARITHLAYAPEIAAAMLQRQQASAVIDARQMIVEGAVGMVELALAKLSANNIVTLDDERKAAMVSNLMVVLCGNRDAQPVVNSGSLY